MQPRGPKTSNTRNSPPVAIRQTYREASSVLLSRYGPSTGANLSLRSAASARVVLFDRRLAQGIPQPLSATSARRASPCRHCANWRHRRRQRLRDRISGAARKWAASSRFGVSEGHGGSVERARRPESGPARSSISSAERSRGVVVMRAAPPIQGGHGTATPTEPARHSADHQWPVRGGRRP
jgi:hypothetical protein